MRTVCLILALCLFTPLLRATTDLPDFRKAVESYEAGNYQESVDLLEGLVAREEYSANLFYNLGNSWFQLDQPARALVNYERALLIEPNHPEARHNLGVAQRALDQEGWNEVETWASRISNGLAGWTGLLAFWIGIFSLAALALPKGRAWKIPVAILCLLWASICAVVLLWQHHHLTGPQLAVVVSDKAIARFAPTETSGDAGPIREGEPLRILTERDGWVYAQFEDGRRLWIALGEVERIRYQ